MLKEAKTALQTLSLRGAGGEGGGESRTPYIYSHSSPLLTPIPPIPSLSLAPLGPHPFLPPLRPFFPLPLVEAGIGHVGVTTLAEAVALSKNLTTLILGGANRLPLPPPLLDAIPKAQPPFPAPLLSFPPDL